MERREFWVIGGDERQVILAGLLAGDGHRVHGYALEERLRCEQSLDGIETAGCIILPLPVSDGQGRLPAPLSQLRLGAEELLDRLRPGQRILAGRIPPGLQRAAERRGLFLEDYFAREELAVRNAVPTAEGAVRIALEQLPVTLHDARVLVIGFGRLGLALAPRLRALGAHTWVAARSPAQRAQAEGLGVNVLSLEDMSEWLHTFDLVVNTVPALILGVEELASLKEGAVVIDLASLPGGADDESAAALGVRVIHALSLPGREAPLTAGRYLRDTVYHMLEGKV